MDTMFKVDLYTSPSSNILEFVSLYMSVASKELFEHICEQKNASI